MQNEDEKATSPLRLKPATLRSTYGERLFLASFSSGFPAPWYSGWEVELQHRDLAVVAFLWFKGIQTNILCFYSTKQQRLMARITALRSRARLGTLVDTLLQINRMNY